MEFDHIIAPGGGVLSASLYSKYKPLPKSKGNYPKVKFCSGARFL